MKLTARLDTVNKRYKVLNYTPHTCLSSGQSSASFIHSHWSIHRGIRLCIWASALTVGHHTSLCVHSHSKGKERKESYTLLLHPMFLYWTDQHCLQQIKFGTRPEKKSSFFQRVFLNWLVILTVVLSDLWENNFHSLWFDSCLRELIFTALHAMQTQSSDENSVCSSVCLSVTRVDCDKTVERSVQIYIPYERTFSLVLWEEEWLVGGEPFYLKFWVNRPPLKRNRRFSTNNRS